MCVHVASCMHETEGERCGEPETPTERAGEKGNRGLATTDRGKGSRGAGPVTLRQWCCNIPLLRYDKDSILPQHAKTLRLGRMEEGLQLLHLCALHTDNKSTLLPLIWTKIKQWVAVYSYSHHGTHLILALPQAFWKCTFLALDTCTNTSIACQKIKRKFHLTVMSR